VTTTEHLETRALVDAPAPAVEPEHAVEVPSPPRDRGRLLSVVVVLMALTPLVVGAVSIIRRGFPPGALFGDRAILGLTAGNAWRAPVLLGPYSRFYWHHPGPLYFYVLNVLSAIFGGGTVGLVLGAVAINVSASAGILVLALRRGGRALLVWAAILLTAYLFVIDPFPFDIWNPSVTILPFALVLLLAWSVACGDWWAAPWLALFGSFVVQTHVGLVPGVAMALGFTVVVCVVRQRRSEAPLAVDERRALRRSLATSAVVTFVVWLPPLVEELTSRRGNLTELARFFSRPGSPHSLAEGLTNTGLQATLMLRGVFESVSLRADAHQGLAFALVVSAVAFVGAVIAALRMRSTKAAALLALVAFELVVGVYGVTKIVGPVQYYLVQWISAVGFVLWIAIGNAVLELVRARRVGWSRGRTWSRAALAVAFVVLCVGAVRAVPGHAGLINEDLDVPNNRALFGYVPTKQLLAATDAGRIVVLRNDEATAWEVLAADALMLEQHGRRVQIVETQETRLLFDDARLVRNAPADAQVLSFRERARPDVRAGDALIARQGKWSIVRVGED
jgi:hypothetical protein